MYTRCRFVYTYSCKYILVDYDFSLNMFSVKCHFLQSVKSTSNITNQSAATKSVQPARNGPVSSDDLSKESNGVSFHTMTT
jgi:hypothetical protein